ncbi:MAG: hypothetical protein HC785_01680 [Calothrix sp. CSU_2_0]|nr:hypothetical protein [Calothrix sp. CSU_2_0]
MGVNQVEAFLTHLAVQEKVSASTQNQAFNALLFLYREVLNIDLGQGINAKQAKTTRYVPTVLTAKSFRWIIDCDSLSRHNFPAIALLQVAIAGDNCASTQIFTPLALDD